MKGEKHMENFIKISARIPKKIYDKYLLPRLRKHKIPLSTGTAARFVDDGEEVDALLYLPKKEYLPSVMALANEDLTDDLEKLSEYIESMFDHEIDWEMTEVPGYLLELDRLATLKSQPPFLLMKVSVAEPDDVNEDYPEDIMYALTVNGDVYDNDVEGDVIKDHIEALSKGFIIGAEKTSNLARVDLLNGHALVAEAGTGDYPQVEITIDGNPYRTVLATEYQDDTGDEPQLKTYFYADGDEVSDTYTQKFADIADTPSEEE